jgi:hypothetical protein
MDNKEIVKIKSEEIDNERKNFQQERERILTELDTKQRTHDEKIAKLQVEQNTAALAEKLKDYPAELVKDHPTCNVCGAKMRPFQIAEDEKVVKFWACQNGSLSDTHDLIRVG